VFLVEREMGRQKNQHVEKINTAVEQEAMPIPVDQNPRKYSAPLYLTRSELAAKSGLSTSTIHRYKLRWVIPFYQPGGKGARVLFPPDAIEAATSAANSELANTEEQIDSPELPHRAEPMPGRRPLWMKPPINTESEA
jgi:hypothetical protein